MGHTLVKSTLFTFSVILAVAFSTLYIGQGVVCVREWPNLATMVANKCVSATFSPRGVHWPPRPTPLASFSHCKDFMKKMMNFVIFNEFWRLNGCVFLAEGWPDAFFSANPSFPHDLGPPRGPLTDYMATFQCPANSYVRIQFYR